MGDFLESIVWLSLDTSKSIFITYVIFKHDHLIPFF